MAPLKTMCDEVSLFKYFLILIYLFGQSFHPFHYLTVKKTFFPKKELPAGKYMYASPHCVQFQMYRSV